MHTMENSLIRYILLTYCPHVHIVVVVVVVVITKDSEARVSYLRFTSISLPGIILSCFVSVTHLTLSHLTRCAVALYCARHYTLALFVHHISDSFELDWTVSCRTRAHKWNKYSCVTLPCTHIARCEHSIFLPAFVWILFFPVVVVVSVLRNHCECVRVCVGVWVIRLAS